MENYFAVAEVCIPNTILDNLSFGINDQSIVRGSVVEVSLKGRKKPLLGLVLSVHKNFPKFKLKPATACGHVFSERYVETFLWCANYYMCSLGEALTAFWPVDLRKYLLSESGFSGFKDGQDICSAPVLTVEQRNAVDALIEMLHAANFRGALLHGVTGSGKTRVYLEVVREALSLGLKTLILVPEINLTPQTRKRFEDFLNCEIPILHSKLGAKEKRKTWQRLLNPHTPILMGTRSAILAPFEPQLIIIDEEHDASYKQQDPAPRYNVREMAFHIAHKYGALVILGSATPSLETYGNAKNGNLKLIEMKSRPGGLPLPKVIIADMKEERKKQDKDLMLSPILRDALSKTISEGNQAIILLNRRGYSTNRICEECGNPLQCTDCNVALVYHKQHDKLACHYCGKLFPTDIHCKCGSKKFAFFGSGIEKAEEEIKEWLPNAKVLRLDADTTSGLGTTEKLLQKFRDKECNVLLGTQMVAKGHDFPDVSLVGILCADIGSSIPDFRAGERYFQLLTQVAGRAGRFLENSQVIIQTFCPENPVMQFAIKHDYQGFSKTELTERQEAFYPPFCKITQIRIQAKDKQKLQMAASEAANLLGMEHGIKILGPAEPFVSKAQKYFRMVITIKSENPANIKNAIKNVLPKTPKGVDVRVDRDC
ncbi:MAG: primosomal protein N' [Fibromonadales bacterium]|nr:primosomal protein N' [Fibromonadales bacterium]